MEPCNFHDLKYSLRTGRKNVFAVHLTIQKPYRLDVKALVFIPVVDAGQINVIMRNAAILEERALSITAARERPTNMHREAGLAFLFYHPQMHACKRTKISCFKWFPAASGVIDRVFHQQLEPAADNVPGVELLDTFERESRRDLIAYLGRTRQFPMMPLGL